MVILSAPTLAHVEAVRRTVGSGGRTLVVEPDRRVALEIAEATRGEIQVLNRLPADDDVLGSFDAMLACPLLTLGLTPTFWSRLFSNNLRPGGRFVLDLPSEEMNDHLAACWLQSGGSSEALQGLRGPAIGELVEALEGAGLRELSVSAATHLVHLESPFTLANLMKDAAKDGTDLDDVMLEDLGRHLVARLETTVDVNCIFHRIRARGLH